MGKEFKLTVKVYNKSTNKLVKTLTKNVKVWKKTKDITLDQSAVQLETGATATLTATTSPASYVRPITWTTSDASVATVADGVVTAIAEGTATITAKSETVSASATVTVAPDKMTLSAKQTGSKEFTVTANKSMAGQTISVTRGTATVTATSDVSADGKTAVITLASAAIKADYVITVGDATTTVSAETSTLASISVSPYLILDDAVGTATSATFTYVAYDQFNENITNKCNLNSTTTSGYDVSLNSSKGIGTVTKHDSSVYAFTDLNKSVFVTIYDLHMKQTYIPMLNWLFQMSLFLTRLK